MDNQARIDLLNLRRTLISSLKMVEMLLVDSGALHHVIERGERDQDEPRRVNHIVVRVSN